MLHVATYLHFLLTPPIEVLYHQALSVYLQVRDFQAVIGKEVRQQCLEKMGGAPDILLACVGGGSNAIGLFHEFVDDEHVRLIGTAMCCNFKWSVA